MEILFLHIYSVNAQSTKVKILSFAVDCLPPARKCLSCSYFYNGISTYAAATNKIRLVYIFTSIDIRLRLPPFCTEMTKQCLYVEALCNEFAFDLLLQSWRQKGDDNQCCILGVIKVKSVVCLRMCVCNHQHLCCHLQWCAKY